MKISRPGKPGLDRRYGHGFRAERETVCYVIPCLTCLRKAGEESVLPKKVKCAPFKPVLPCMRLTKDRINTNEEIVFP